MICGWNELVECGVSLLFIVIMNRDSYSWTDQNEKTGLLFVDGGSKRVTICCDHTNVIGSNMVVVA